MMNLLFVEVQLMQTLLNERTSVNYSRPMIGRAAVHLAVATVNSNIFNDCSSRRISSRLVLCCGNVFYFSLYL